MFINQLDGKNEGTISQDRLRLANHIIILPILHNAFQKQKDILILSPDIITELRTKIKDLHVQNNCPAWVLVEITLLLDYIVAKTNLTIRNGSLNEFLEDVLIFAWKNIGSPRENNKLLRNMSKLLVSRLIARFEKLKS